MSQSVVGNLYVGIHGNATGLNSTLNQAMNASQNAAKTIANNMNSAQQAAGNNKGMSGFALGLSRAIDDAQYGFRGIINNMEQLGTSAAQALGMTSSSAMAAGAALTLIAISINNIIDDLERIADPRSGFEKLATSAAGFSSSLIRVRAELKMMQEDLTAAEKDNTTGMGAFFQRQAKALADWNNRNSMGGNTLFSRAVNALGARTFEDQVAANRQGGQAAANIQNNLLIQTEVARKQEAAYRAGIGLVANDISPSRNTIDEAYKKAFENTAPGNAGQMQGQLIEQYAKEGVSRTEATQKSLELLGDASMGVKSAFEELAKRLPQYKLAEKADDVLNAEARINREAFDKAEAQRQERRRGLLDRAAAIETNMKRSEIVGTADVFVRNLNAGIGEDPQIKELKEIKEEIKKLKPIGALG